jgi:hypothetical protein
MDSESLLLVAVAAIVWAPMIIRAFKSDKKKPKKGAEPEPLCGCEHHLAFHTSEGVCKAQKQRWTGTNDRGYSQYDIVSCTCQQYVGPVPDITPQIMRELTRPTPAVEPYSQDK